jgi:hypothetical protein
VRFRRREKVAPPAPPLPPPPPRPIVNITISENDPTWQHLGHVDPPPASPGNERALIFYLGPNHYPAGLYLPQGYDLQSRKGREGWTVLRARDGRSHQTLTIWAVSDNEAEVSDEDRVRILDP